MIALFLNGVRYEAGMRNAFGGSASALEITPGGHGDRRIWNVRNVGLGPETIVGVSASNFPRRGGVALSRSSFENFAGRRRMEVGETLPFDVTTGGDDLLVAVLSEHIDGRHSVSWARFRAVKAGGAYEKREDGRLLSI